MCVRVCVCVCSRARHEGRERIKSKTPSSLGTLEYNVCMKYSVVLDEDPEPLARRKTDAHSCEDRQLTR